MDPTSVRLTTIATRSAPPSRAPGRARRPGRRWPSPDPVVRSASLRRALAGLDRRRADQLGQRAILTLLAGVNLTARPPQRAPQPADRHRRIVDGLPAEHHR